MFKKYVMLLALACFTATILGCNMLKGAGKDVENAGKGVQRTVEHND